MASWHVNYPLAYMCLMLLQRQRATWSEHSSELYSPLSVKRGIPIEKGNTDTNAPPDPNDEIFLAAP